MTDLRRLSRADSAFSRAALLATQAGRLAVSPAGRNTFWLVADKMTRAVFAALVTAWVARYLGPARFSTIAYGLAIVAFLQPLAQLGLSSVVFRDLSQRPENAGAIVQSALVLRGISGVLCLAGAVAFLFLTESQAGSAVVGSIICLLLVFQLAEIFEIWFQSRLESRVGTKFRMVVIPLVAGLKVALILLKMPLWTFAVATALESALVLVSLMIAYAGRSGAQKSRWNAGRLRQMALEGMPYLFSGLAVAVYMRFDQILLKHMAGDAAMGAYAAIVPLALVWQMVSSSVLTSLTPGIYRAADAGAFALEQKMRQVFMVIGFLNLAAALLNAAAAPLVVKLLLGPDFTVAVPALQIYGFTNIFVGIGSAWGVWVAATRNGRLLLYNAVTGGTVSIASNIILIRLFGGIGAAISANISFMCSSILMNYFTCRTIFFLQIGFGLFGRGR